MKTKNSRTVILSTLVLSLVAAGCAKPPETEIATTRGAVDTARAAEAETWASEEWEQAQAALTAIDEELAAQKNKLALTRSYDRTRELVAAAQKEAEEARTAAVANKETARRQASEAIETTRDTLASAEVLRETLTTCPKKPKGFEADLASVTGSLQALQTELATLQGLYDGGSFNAATEEATALRNEVDLLKTDLEGAMEKIGCQAPAPSTTA